MGNRDFGISGFQKEGKLAVKENVRDDDRALGDGSACFCGEWVDFDF
jgi:hypothetical protein